VSYNPFDYAHMCRDQHVQIGHDYSGDDERCPLCQAIDALEQIMVTCADNAGATVRHDLALKFVGDVAAKTHAALVMPPADHAASDQPKPGQ
jgi:hypothetical protein